MHWANTVLDAGDVEKLYYTNFGDNGTRLDWTVYRTNFAGVNQETLYSGTQLMPFADPAIHSTWFTHSGTRFVIALPDGTDSYGGLIKSINGTSINKDQDSIFIPDQNFAVLKFHKLSNPPNAPPETPNLATPENYNAAVFLSGFDGGGNTFLRTINIGNINVVN